MVEREEDFLKRAWREMAVPTPEESYERPDAETRRAVDWLQRAWAESEPAAPVEIPWRARLRARRAAGRAPLGLWAAAAALFLAASLWIHFELRPSMAPAPTTLDVGSAPSIEVATILNAGDEPEVVVASITPEHTELRSGPVRLILLPTNTNPTEPTNEAPR